MKNCSQHQKDYHISINEVSQSSSMTPHFFKEMENIAHLIAHFDFEFDEIAVLSLALDKLSPQREFIEFFANWLLTVFTQLNNDRFAVFSRFFFYYNAKHPFLPQTQYDIQLLASFRAEQSEEVEKISLFFKLLTLTNKNATTLVTKFQSIEANLRITFKHNYFYYLLLLISQGDKDIQTAIKCSFTNTLSYLKENLKFTNYFSKLLSCFSDETIESL